MRFSKSLPPSLFVFFLALNALGFLFLKLNWSELRSGVSASILFHVTFFTIYQATISAAISVLIGVLAAPGYSCLGNWRRIARWILLFPNLMSSVLVVLCLLLTLRDFPYGIWGIVIGHIFLNAGLCTVWIGERWRSLDIHWAPVSKVTGSSPSFYFFRVMLPLIWPQVRNTFCVIFSFCLASFAIPLILGGGPGASTLEVLTYEMVHGGGNISWATGIGVLQGLIQIIAFIFLVKRDMGQATAERLPPQPFRFSFWHFGTLSVFLISIFPVYRFFSVGILQSIKSGGFSEILYDPAFAAAAVTSSEVALAIFASTVLLLGWLVTSGWFPQVPRIPTLSGVAVGLAGILLFHLGGRTTPFTFFVALFWGHLSVVFLPVFRLSLPFLESLREKYEKVSVQLGAGQWLKFKRIYWGLGMRTFFAAGGLAACWSMGDFSVARTFGFSQATLPIYIQDLMGSYRLEQSAVASLLLIGLTFVALVLMEVVSNGVG